MLLICPIIVLLATIYSSWFELVIVSAEGRVEHQKRNQTATSKLPVGFVFGVQLGLRQTRALIQTRKNKLLQVEQLWDK